MDDRTGEIYASYESAKEAEVPDEHIVTGHRKALHRLSRLIKAEKRARNRRQRESRKQNR